MKIIRGESIQFEPASHEDPKDPGVLKKVLLQHTDLIDGKLQMVNWAKLPVGKSFQKHYHEDMEEVFIIINGKASITVGNETNELVAGDAVVISVAAVHEMKNIGIADVDYIAIGVTIGKDGKTIVVNN